MSTLGSLAALDPARRSELIYREARASLDQRLWRAALGSPSDTRDATPDLSHKPMSLETLLAQIAEDAVKPATPPPAAPVVTPVVASEPAPVRAAGLGANARYGPVLDAAAERTGIPAAALAAIVDAEAAKGRDGGWNTMSRNPRSSAAGLGQFLSRTWEGLANTRGTWLNDVAAQRGWLDGAGRVRADSRATLLGLRYDGTASIHGIADFARQNLNGMRRAGVSVAGDVQATARAAYLGHHLGLRDAIRFTRDGGLESGRAKMLLNAQIGGAASQRQLKATAGDASAAHRNWLISYLDRKIQPGIYATRA